MCIIRKDKLYAEFDAFNNFETFSFLIELRYYLLDLVVYHIVT